MTLAAYLFGAALCLSIQAMFAAFEISILSLDHVSPVLKDPKVTLLRKSPERLFSVTLLFVNLCVIVLSGLSSLYFHAYESFGSILLTSALIVVFGELIPKSLGRRYATHLARPAAHFLSAVDKLVWPITYSLRFLTRNLPQWVSPLGHLATQVQQVKREDLELALLSGQPQTEGKKTERRMLERILEFRTTEAKRAMIPLIKVDALELRSTVEQAIESYRRHRHSRVPVYDGRIDHIVGVLEMSRLQEAHRVDQAIEPFVTPALYVAELQNVETILFALRSDKREMGIVVDEHGGAVGILTMEDIVEEIVGEISDEFDTGEPASGVWSLIQRAKSIAGLARERFAIQARAEIRSLNEALQLDLPEGEYETLGGFLTQQFQCIPDQGDELFFSTQRGNLKFTVERSNERVIERVLVEVLEDSRD